LDYSELRPRHKANKSDRIGIFQIGVNGGDDYARFDGNQINSDQGDTNPGINDDSFVQYAIENID
jgi:hypothetical protein